MLRTCETPSWLILRTRRLKKNKPLTGTTESTWWYNWGGERKHVLRWYNLKLSRASLLQQECSPLQLEKKMAHFCLPSALDIEAGGSQVWGQPGLHSKFQVNQGYVARHKTLSQKLETNKQTKQKNNSNPVLGPLERTKLQWNCTAWLSFKKKKRERK